MKSNKERSIASLYSIALCALMPYAHAYTPAGTVIWSPTYARFETPDGAPRIIQARDVIDLVDELIELRIETLEPSSIATAPGKTNQLARFQIINEGNGTESIRLQINNSLSGDQFDPIAAAIFIDNGDGQFDPQFDTLYQASHPAPVLGMLGTASNSVTVFVLNNIPDDTRDQDQGQTRLIARAASGYGTTGTIIEGAGDTGQNGGTTAIVIGFSGGEDHSTATYLVETAALSAQKSVELYHPDHPVLTEAIPGATLRYTIRTRVLGGGTVENVLLTDPIPSLSSYTPNSLTLNGTSLTDTLNDDAGGFDAATNRIVVELGNLSEDDGEQIIIFETTLNKENQ